MTDAGASRARPTVYLHLGTPKSGTTYLQNMLWRHRETLREQGVLYPGEAYPAHYWATLDLQDATYRDHAYPEVPGAWDRLVAEAAAWDGTVIISHELLSRSKPGQVKRALSALDFADVHLVLTVRDLARQIPAAWQETVKNRFGVGFAEFVAQLQDGKGEHGRAFWRMQDVPDILRRWDAGVPEENVHLVTVPPSRGPRDLLWHRFAGLLGIDHAKLPRPQVEANTSVGAVETGFLRLLNDRLDERMDWPAYERLVKHGLVTKVLAGRSRSRRIELSEAEHAWAADRAARMLAELGEHAYDIVGDLEELAPTARAVRKGAHPDEASAEELLEVALDAVAALLGSAAERDRGSTATERELADLRERLATTQQELRAAYERPVLRHSAHRVGQRVPAVMSLLEEMARRRDRARKKGGSE